MSAARRPRSSSCNKSDAKDLAQLISLKDSSSYGLIHANLNELEITMRRAKALLAFATKIFNEG